MGFKWIKHEHIEAWADRQSAQALLMWKKKEGKGKEDFVESEINKYGWKDIRIIDSLVIEQWLELAPSVAVWFAEKNGISIEQLQSAEKYYESYAKTIKGILPPSFFIGERANNLSELKQCIENNLDKKSCDYYIKCDSICEGILTFIAYLKENRYKN